jgi:hypothetical protein
MLSFEQRRQAIQIALRAKFTSLADDYWWIVATFDDYVIVEKGDEHFRVSYTVGDDDDIEIGDESKVEITYTPVSEGVAAILCPAAPLVEGQEPDGSRWSCVLIEEGVSMNRRRHRREVLEEAVSKYDGVPVTGNTCTPISGRLATPSGSSHTLPGHCSTSRAARVRGSP